MMMKFALLKSVAFFALLSLTCASSSSSSEGGSVDSKTLAATKAKAHVDQAKESFGKTKKILSDSQKLYEATLKGPDSTADKAQKAVEEFLVDLAESFSAEGFTPGTKIKLDFAGQEPKPKVEKKEDSKLTTEEKAAKEEADKKAKEENEKLQAEKGSFLAKPEVKEAAEKFLAAIFPHLKVNESVSGEAADAVIKAAEGLSTACEDLEKAREAVLVFEQDHFKKENSVLPWLGVSVPVLALVIGGFVFLNRKKLFKKNA